MQREELEDLETDLGETAALEQGMPDPIDDYNGESTEVLSEKYRRLVEDDL
jgi:hypothetical protein